jgi:hypothetical protein
MFGPQRTEVTAHVRSGCEVEGGDPSAFDRDLEVFREMLREVDKMPAALKSVKRVMSLVDRKTGTTIDLTFCEKLMAPSERRGFGSTKWVVPAVPAVKRHARVVSVWFRTRCPCQEWLLDGFAACGGASYPFGWTAVAGDQVLGTGASIGLSAAVVSRGLKSVDPLLGPT